MISNLGFSAFSFIANLKYSAYPEFLGNEYVSQKLELDYNHFFEMKNEKDLNEHFVADRADLRSQTAPVPVWMRSAATRPEPRSCAALARWETNQAWRSDLRGV